MSDFLGTQVDYFSAVCNLGDMDRFVEDVSQVLDRPVTIGRFQTGGPKLDPSVLSSKQVKKIKHYYAADYKAYSDYL